MADDLLNTEELAQYLRKPVATVYAMNSRGTGPRRMRIGKTVLYRRSDVEMWLDEHAIEPEPAA